MNNTIGNPTVFAIDWSLKEAYESASLLGLGSFTIFVAGRRFGVPDPDATILANSYEGVQERINCRGTHVVPFQLESAETIAKAVHYAYYQTERKEPSFFDLSLDELGSTIRRKKILWAPDGDAAFDDGSHVLHFDVGDKVRLIAFINSFDMSVISATLKEAWVDSDEFYTTLERWISEFNAQRSEGNGSAFL